MNRGKMERSERAKQFMPFAALKGFEELLAEKEKMIVQKIELSEERKAELDDSVASFVIYDALAGRFGTDFFGEKGNLWRKN